MNSKIGLILSTLISSAAYASLPHITLNLTVVNGSNQPVCISGNHNTQCIDHGSKSINLETQNFYHRSGVIRVSIGDQPATIGMLKLDTNHTDLYVDQSAHLHTKPGTFEPGSFEYSNDLDYLHFVAKPEGLFTPYPL